MHIKDTIISVLGSRSNNYYIAAALVIVVLIEAGNVSDCPLEDSLCEKDKLGYEAICQLHRQIDDDHNGNLDRAESDEVSAQVW